MSGAVNEATPRLIAGVEMTHAQRRVMARQAMQLVNDAIEQRGAKVLTGFTRRAAAAHEAAHAILYTVEGYSVRRIKVWRRHRDYGSLWAGFTEAGEEWEITTRTPLPEICRRVRITVAGWLGEIRVIGREQAAGSSTDELALAMTLAQEIGRREKRKPKDVYTQLEAQTRDIIEHNADVHDKLTTALMNTKTLQRQRLAILLRAVR